MNRITILLTLFSASFAQVEPQHDPPECWVRIEVTQYGDGDSFHGKRHLPWGVTLREQKIRCVGYDAWESTRHRFGDETTDEELAKGKRAAEQFEALLESSQVVYGAPGNEDRDGRGRPLVRLMVIDKDGKRVDVAEWMEERKHVRIPNSEVLELYGQ